MTDVGPEDMAALRREGDRGRFFRDLIAEGKSRRTTPPKPVAPRPPGHKPGAWPAGARPPDPPPPIDPAVVAAALADYRAHVVAAEDRGVAADRTTPCLCKPCQKLAHRPEEVL